MARTPCPADYYASRFRSFQRSAFRLETRSEYLVESEQADYAAYRSGELLPPPRQGILAEWDRLVAESVRGGKVMRRVHLMTQPLTPYLRYEIEWGYVFTASAGEQIRLLLPDVAQLGTRATVDYWLFDDNELFFVNYDKQGRYVSVDLETDEEEIRLAAALRDELWERATCLQLYLANVRNG